MNIILGKTEDGRERATNWGNGNNDNSEMTDNKGKVVEKGSDSKAIDRVARHK